jgi:hypothetical protein
MDTGISIKYSAGEIRKKGNNRSWLSEINNRWHSKSGAGV